MADIQELRRYLDDIKSGMQSINDLSLEIEEQSENLIGSIASFSGIGTKGGIIRSIITRASTGTGLFNVTQRLTSALLVIRYIDKTQKDRLEEEKKFNKLMSDREKIMKTIFKMQRDSIKTLDKERFYNDAAVRMKLKTLSIDEAIAETRESLEKSTSKLRRAGRRALGGQAQRLLLRGRIAGRGMRDIQSRAFGLVRGSAIGAGLLTMNENELMAGQERLQGLGTEEADILKKLGVKEREFDEEGLSSSAKERIREELKFLRGSLKAIQDTAAEVKDNMRAQAFELIQNVDELAEERGLSTLTRSASRRSGYSQERRAEQLIEAIEAGNENVILGFDQMTLMQSLAFKYQKLKDKAQERLDKIRGYFKSEDFKLLKSFMLKGLMVFSGLILGMSALVALIFTLYYLGIGEWFVSVGKAVAASFEKFSLFYDIFSGGFMMLFEGLWQVITGFIGVIYGMFTGDGELISESTGKFFKGIGNVLLGVGGVLIGGLLTVVQALFVGGIAMVLTGIGNIFGKVEGFGGFVGSVAGAGLGMYGGAKAGAMIGTLVAPGIGTVAGGIIGGVGGAIAGGNLGVKIGNLLGYANGGTTPYSGTFLVGERGPELVSLPGNSRVFNNSDTSRMMSPTININVTGRVGASDTELNDIARKIGQKINIEMNRYNLSGLRG